MVAVGISYRQTIARLPARGRVLPGGGRQPGRGRGADRGGRADARLRADRVGVGRRRLHAITSALPGLRRSRYRSGVLVIAAAARRQPARGTHRRQPLRRSRRTPSWSRCWRCWRSAPAGRPAGVSHRWPAPVVPAAEGLGLLLVLRAFASGAVSMTGIEAVSNAVPAFRPTEWRNARTTLTWMVAMLVVLFAGLVLLIHLAGLVPRRRRDAAVPARPGHLPHRPLVRPRPGGHRADPAAGREHRVQRLSPAAVLHGPRRSRAAPLPAHGRPAGVRQRPGGAVRRRRSWCSSRSAGTPRR